MKKIKLFQKLNCYINKLYFKTLCFFDIKKAVIITYSNSLDGTEPDLVNPKTINEKLQYLKLNDYYNNPTVTECIDKYAVKNHSIIKELYPLLKTAKSLTKAYSNVDSFLNNEFDKLPNQFVIKCNHGCGFNYVCENKNSVDLLTLRKTLKNWIKTNYWTQYAEPQYKFIPKRVFAEEFLGKDLAAIKIYCCNGIPKICYLSSPDENGKADFYLDFYDMNWNHIDVTLSGHKNAKELAAKPEKFDEMINISKTISKNFKFVRVDLYLVNNEIYLSELTFLPTGGYMKFNKPSFADEMGKWLDITN